MSDDKPFLCAAPGCGQVCFYSPFGLSLLVIYEKCYIFK